MTNKLTPEQLVPGAIVMVGPTALRSGGYDRSWCDSIWRVEAVTGQAVLCRKMSRLDGYSDLIFMRSDERTWWQAAHVLDAYNVAVSEVRDEYAQQRDEATSYEHQVRSRCQKIISDAVAS